MSLYQTLRDSFHSPGFYRSLKLRPASFSVGYFLSLIALCSVIITVLLSLLGLPRLVSLVRVLGEPLASSLDADLEISLNSGTFSINRSGTYELGVSENTRRAVLDWPGAVPEYLLVVDAGAEDPAKGLADRRSLIFVGRSGLAFMTETGILTQSAAGLPDATIGREDLARIRDSFASWGGWLGLVLVVGIFLAFFLLFASILIYLLPGALVVRLTAHLRGNTLGYWESYRASIHLASIALVIYLILGTLFLGFGVPFLPFLVLILITGSWSNYPPSGNSRRAAKKPK